MSSSISCCTRICGRSGKSDEIGDSVNYKTIKKSIITLVEASRFRLLEKLAEEIAGSVSDRQPGSACGGDRGQAGSAPVCEIRRGFHRPGARRDMSGTVVAYIGVGSNIDPVIHIPSALELLAASVRVTGTSTFHRNAALNRPDQPDYVNGVWRIETVLSPVELRDTILRPIEGTMGRVRGSDPWSARTIDLDILLFDTLIIRGNGITIPDPNLYTRPFIAVPLAELAPDLVLPDTGLTAAEVAASLAADGLIPETELTQRLRERIGA